MMLHTLRPVRASACRLLATPFGANSTLDNHEHPSFAPVDTSFPVAQPLTVSAVATVPSGYADGWQNSIGPVPIAYSDAGDAQLFASNMPCTGTVLLQPVLMPVFRPFYGVRGSTDTEGTQPINFPSQWIVPLQANDEVAQQCIGASEVASFEVGEPAINYDEARDTSTQEPSRHCDSSGVCESEPRKQRRSKRGGAAARRRREAAAACPEEVAEAQRAVEEIERACSMTKATSENHAKLILDNSPAPSVASATVEQSPSAQTPGVGVGTSITHAKTVETVRADEKLAQPLDTGNLIRSAAVEQDPLAKVSTQCLETQEAVEEKSFVDDASSTEACVDPLCLELESNDDERRQFALEWVLSSFWPLTLTKRGCRIVQKALEVSSPAYQQQLVDNLRGHVLEALQSPHANYVLQKCIEVMPPDRMSFVLAELKGETSYFARHRFGCRILQRLIEHCPPTQTEALIGELLVDVDKLCRHQYGNFVVQHILQHGALEHRSAIAEVLCQDVIRLAKHRISSHVVSCAMVHCAPDDVQRLTQVVLEDAGKLADLSRREYGSFVVREVHRASRLLRAE